MTHGILSAKPMAEKGQNAATKPALVALGANLGQPIETLVRARARLAALAPVVGDSGNWRTPCFPAGSGPDYVNAVLALDWSGTAADLLYALHQIEADLGRVRQKRWGPRVIDLDLLALGSEVLPDAAVVQGWMQDVAAAQGQRTPDQLLVPHPRLHERAFVLGPLLMVAPHWVHPLRGKSVAALWAALPLADRGAISPAISTRSVDRQAGRDRG